MVTDTAPLHGFDNAIVIKKLFRKGTNPKAYIWYDKDDKPYDILTLFNFKKTPEFYRGKWKVRLHPYSLIDRERPWIREYNENTWKTELKHHTKHFFIEIDPIVTT